MHVEDPTGACTALDLDRGRRDPREIARPDAPVARHEQPDAHPEGFLFSVAVHLLRALIPGRDAVPEVADDDGIVGVQHHGGQPPHGLLGEFAVVDVDHRQHGALGPAPLGLALVGPVRPYQEVIPASPRVLNLQLLDGAVLDHVLKQFFQIGNEQRQVDIHDGASDHLIREAEHLPRRRREAVDRQVDVQQDHRDVDVGQEVREIVVGAAQDLVAADDFLGRGGQFLVGRLQLLVGRLELLLGGLELLVDALQLLVAGEQ